jgi:hypothetical protein
MRLVFGDCITCSGARKPESSPLESLVLEVLVIVAGLLLLAGLWTPVSGSLVGILEILKAVSQPGDPLANILLGTIGVSLALLGPGAYSADARLFGWRRIDVGEGRN